MTYYIQAMVVFWIACIPSILHQAQVGGSMSVNPATNGRTTKNAPPELESSKILTDAKTSIATMAEESDFIIYWNKTPWFASAELKATASSVNIPCRQSFVRCQVIIKEAFDNYCAHVKRAQDCLTIGCSDTEAELLKTAACAIVDTENTTTSVLTWDGVFWYASPAFRTVASSMPISCRRRLMSCRSEYQDIDYDYCQMSNRFCLSSESKFSRDLCSVDHVHELHKAACSGVTMTTPPSSFTVPWTPDPWTASLELRTSVAAMSPGCKFGIMICRDRKVSSYNNYCDFYKGEYFCLVRFMCKTRDLQTFSKIACSSSTTETAPTASTAVSQPDSRPFSVIWNSSTWLASSSLKVTVSSLRTECKQGFSTCRDISIGFDNYCDWASKEQSCLTSHGCDNGEAKQVINAACSSSGNGPSDKQLTDNNNIVHALKETSRACRTQLEACRKIDSNSRYCPTLHKGLHRCSSFFESVDPGCSRQEWAALTRAACGGVGHVMASMLAMALGVVLSFLVPVI